MLLCLGRKLSRSFGELTIFKDVDIEIKAGEKAALIGRNGAGKTTLLRILAGIDRPDAGRLDFFTDADIALLPQEPVFPCGRTVGDLLLTALPESAPEKLFEETIRRFGFTGILHNHAQALSGGEKTRLKLACLWMKKPGLLLLDEPTNHLDTFWMGWLEEFVREYPGAVVMVSHDRYFLDRVVTRVMELAADGLTSYPGNYSGYKREKQVRFEQALKTYDDREKEIRKIKRAINAQVSWAASAHQQSRKKAIARGVKKGGKEYYRAKAKKIDRRVKSTVKRLERMQEERVAKPREAKTIDLSFEANRKGGQRLILAEGITKSYGALRVLNGCDFSLQPRQKAALTGKNGSGKTTLLKIILGQESFEKGSLWLSPSLKIAYLDQELDSLHDARTVLEEIDTQENPEKARFLLADLLFRGDDLNKPCGVLSMGERVRVALAKILTADYNLLLLDEPTNYLDLASRQKLEEALSSFEGALIIVSHDRYLLERVCDHVWAIEDGVIKTFPGKYSEYIAKSEAAQKEPRLEKEERLRLEMRMAAINGELAGLDKNREQDKYLALEREYFEIAERLNSNR